jgi:hypothetical protein
MAIASGITENVDLFNDTILFDEAERQKFIEQEGVDALIDLCEKYLRGLTDTPEGEYCSLDVLGEKIGDLLYQNLGTSGIQILAEQGEIPLDMAVYMLQEVSESLRVRYERSERRQPQKNVQVYEYTERVNYPSESPSTLPRSRATQIRYIINIFIHLRSPSIILGFPEELAFWVEAMLRVLDPNELEVGEA